MVTKNIIKGGFVMLYNITYRNDFGEEVKYERISEQMWRFIRASCAENGWEILEDEPAN